MTLAINSSGIDNTELIIASYIMQLYPSLVDRLHHQHETIRPLIGSIHASRINLVPAPGKWSIHDQIAHLTKYQPVFIGRINTILQQDTPAFERYKAEDDPEFETWRTYDIEKLLAQLRIDRKILFTFITGLTDDQLKRKGLHKKFGALTVVQWTEFFLLHEAHHLFTIFQLTNDVDL